MSLSYHVDTLHDTLVVWQVMQLIQETKFIAKLGLEVPPIAHKLLFLVPTLKSTKLIMEQLVDSYTLLVARVPERLAKALDPAVRRLQAKMVPGVNKISWMSVNVDGDGGAYVRVRCLGYPERAGLKFGHVVYFIDSLSFYLSLFAHSTFCHVTSVCLAHTQRSHCAFTAGHVRLVAFAGV